jgi:hypothetical protein
VRPCSESSPIANDGFLQTGYRQPIAVDLGAFGSNGTFVDVVGPPGFANGLYTPPEGENGNVVISYTVVNSCRLRATGRITIDVNQAPVGSSRTLEVFRGEPVVVPVTDLATDAEALAITAVGSSPSWVTREPDRLVVAPPVGAAAGTVGFTATITDPGGLSTTVDVAVVVQNRPPVANADLVDVRSGAPLTVDLVANDTDVDSGGSLTIVELLPTTIGFSGGGTGTVALQPDGRVTVDPGDGRGTGSFTYRVRDADGATSASATVTVDAPPANQPPVAVDQSISVTVGTSAVVELQVSDPDGQPLQVVGSTLVDLGGVVGDVSGTRITVLGVVPGTFTVTYQVTDGQATSAPAVLTVVVTVPTPPTTTTTTTTTVAPPDSTTTAPP